MKYYLAEAVESVPKDFDWDDVRFFKPSTSLEVVRGRLMQLLGRSCGKTRSIVVYAGSCPHARIEIVNGRIVSEQFVGDQRKEKEVDLDFFYAARSKIKNQKMGRMTGDLSSWIQREGSETYEGVKILDHTNYTPKPSVKRGTMFGERR